MIYADYAATTPVDEDVLEMMKPFFSDCFYNASSTHSGGRLASTAIENARAEIANILNAEKNEIYFTSGGTESDNWAISGVMKASGKKHLITSQIEHHAVINTCKKLETEGYKVTYLPVDKFGVVDLDALKNAITADTALISVMTANNEIGTIQPIGEIGRIAKENNVLFHTDAVQAVGSLDIDVKAENISLLSASAHKFFGPKGIGVLYIKNGVRLVNVFEGGAQERDRRPGTADTPLIVGMAEALKKQYGLRNVRSTLTKKYVDIIRNIVLNELEDVVLNGHPGNRLCGNLNFGFKGIQPEGLLVLLDMKGICCSAGAACSAGAVKVSHVIKAIHGEDEYSAGGIRLSLCHLNTEDEAEFIGKTIVECVNKLRKV